MALRSLVVNRCLGVVFKQLARLSRSINTDRIYNRQFYDTIIEVISKIMGKNGYYAVARGRKIGVYQSWNECRIQTDGYPGCKFKKFTCENDAINYLNSFDTKSVKTEPKTEEIEYIQLGNINNIETKPKIIEITEIQPQPSNPTVQITNWNEINNSSQQIDLITLNSILSTGKYDIKLIPKKIEENEKSMKKSRNMHQSKRQMLKMPSTTMNLNCISIFTDGACESNGRDSAKAGIGVYWGPNHRLNVSEPLKGRQTNNRAEIHAAIRAVNQAKNEGLKEINLHTDSQFLIKSITLWIYKWKKNNWKLVNGGLVKNKEDFEELDKALNGILVHWIYVRGHAGIAGNEAADKLARKGALKNIKCE